MNRDPGHQFHLFAGDTVDGLEKAGLMRWKCKGTP